MIGILGLYQQRRAALAASVYANEVALKGAILRFNIMADMLDIAERQKWTIRTYIRRKRLNRRARECEDIYSRLCFLSFHHEGRPHNTYKGD